MLGLGLDFFALLEDDKLLCYYFMGAGWGHEIPGSETENFTAHSTAARMSMSMSMSAPLAPPCPKWGGLYPCSGCRDFVLELRNPGCEDLPLGSPSV